MAATNEDVLRAIKALQDELKREVRKLDSKLTQISSTVSTIKSRQ